MLSAELVDDSKSVFVRNAAGLALKNALSARVRLSYDYIYSYFHWLCMHWNTWSECSRKTGAMPPSGARSLVLARALPHCISLLLSCFPAIALLTSRSRAGTRVYRHGHFSMTRACASGGVIMSQNSRHISRVAWGTGRFA